MQDQGGKISISSSQNDSWCRFEMADTGPGIPTEIKSKIFDPFFTTRQIGEGKGLGLSTSFGIVSAHQGKLHFQTQEKVGTTFTVELPIFSSPRNEMAIEEIRPAAPVASLIG